MKAEYYNQTLEIEQQNLEFILSKVSLVVRAEIDIYERIYNKGLADPMLEMVRIENQIIFSTIKRVIFVYMVI